MNTHSRTFIAGHRGMVDSALVRRLRAGGYDQLVVRSSPELELELLDLRDAL